MGHHYDQLGLEERIEIYRLFSMGASLRSIARDLGRSTSTISRELARNSAPRRSWKGGYHPVRAEALAQRRRRWDARFKLARQPALRALVRDRLAMGWSPEQIAGRLALDQGKTVISHESIYRFIYHRSAQKDYWHRLLPKRKSRRGRLGRRGGSPVDHIRERTPLSARSKAAGARRQAGHWEADLMLFSRYGQAMLVVHERRSRYLRLTRQPDKTAAATAASLLRWFRRTPPPLRRSVAFDNGTEFAQHTKLKARLSMRTYFCDPHSPWQKGGVENAIGRMRRRLPRKTDLATLPAEDIRKAVNAYNQTPRKCLGFKTPEEVFTKLKTVALQP